jgi:hypothetical protein
VASTQEIQAGKAFVRLFLKNDFSSQLTRALQSAGAKLKSFGSGVMARGALIAGAGAAILAPLTAAVKSFASQGDMLDKMSLRTGIAVGSLAELGFAAEQSGTSLEAVGATVLKMNRRFGRVTAGAGTANQISALEELGLSVDQLRSLDAEGRFLAIGDAVAKYGDDAAAAGLAQRVFGTGIDAVLPLLLQGRKGIAALRAEARDLGIVPTEEEVANAAKVTDALNRVRRVVKSMIFDVGAALVEPALRFMETAKRVAIGVKTWIKNNATLIRTVAAIGAGLVVAGGIVTAFGAAIFAAGSVLTALGTVVAFLTSPIVLIAAAVIGATVAFLRWTESGQAAMQSLTTSLGSLLGWFKEVFGGISDAMAAGDIQLAAEVMWAGIQVAWIKGLSWIRTQWAELRFFLVDLWGKVAFGILDTMNFLWSGMVDGFAKAIDEVVDAWKFAEKSFAKGIGFILAKLQGLDPDEVLANLDQDFGRQQAGRDAGRSARDQANQDAADARSAAIETARQATREAAAGKRDADLAGAEDELDEARKKLADSIDTARKLREKTDAARASEKAVDGGNGPLITAALAAPRGVALTATYSAAAARISGFQPGIAGPEEKMAAGIDGVNENTKQMLVKIGKIVDWVSANVNIQATIERFLAGWKVS